MCRFAIRYLTHCRIDTQTLNIIRIFVATQAAMDRLSQQADYTIKLQLFRNC